MLRVAIVATALLLGGCSGAFMCEVTPLMREYRSLEGKVAEKKGNIERGYAVHSQSLSVVVPGPKGTLLRDSEVVEQPVAIDIDHEKKVLRDLERQLNRLRGPAFDQRAACLDEVAAKSAS